MAPRPREYPTIPDLHFTPLGLSQGRRVLNSSCFLGLTTAESIQRFVSFGLGPPKGLGPIIRRVLFAAACTSTDEKSRPSD